MGRAQVGIQNGAENSVGFPRDSDRCIQAFCEAFRAVIATLEETFDALHPLVESVRELHDLLCIATKIGYKAAAIVAAYGAATCTAPYKYFPVS